MDQLSTTDMRQHVTILGWLRIIGGICFLVLAAALFFLLIGIGAISEDPTAFRVMGLVGLFAGGLMAVLAIPGILAGIGLLRRQNWGRILALIVGFFDLLNFPIGTAIAIYSFFVLLQNSAVAYFKTDHTAQLSPNPNP